MDGERRAPGRVARKDPENTFRRNGWYWGRLIYKGQDLREPLGTKDRGVAVRRVKAWIEDIKDQAWGAKPHRTFDEAAHAFIDEHLPRLKGGVEGASAQRMLYALKHLEPDLAGILLKDIGSAVLSAFEQKRRKQGVTSGTIRFELKCLSSVFTTAQEKEWTDKVNPVSAYIRARAKRGLLLPPDPHTRYLSHDEESELLRRCVTALGGKPHIMLAAAIALTIDIGLRKEELLAAEWWMVDLDRNEWTVPKELAKSGRARTVPILPRSQAILRGLPRSNQTKAVIWRDDHGVHRRYASMLGPLQCIASTTPAMDHVIWHDLRRTCGCRLLQDRKLAIKVVSEWLGHASATITEKVYAFLKVEHLHEAVGTGIADGTRDPAGGLVAGPGMAQKTARGQRRSTEPHRKSQ